MSWLLVLVALADGPLPTAADLSALQFADAPQLSPDGRWVLFGSGGWSFDPEAKPGGDTEGGWTHTRQLYLVASGGGPLRQLTWGEEAPSQAVWSPDGGTVAFVRASDDDDRVHLLPVGGGEARTLDVDDLSPYSLAYSPDGRALRFLSAPSKSEAEKAESFRTGAVERFERDRPHHRLYSLDLATGETTALTDGSRHVLEFTESHAGGRFALTVSEANNAYENTIRPTLALLDDGGVEAVPDAEGCIGSVSFSPNDTRIAWVSCETGGLTDGLRVRDLAGGRTWNALADADPMVEDFVWMPDGSTLLVAVGAKTRTRLWSVPASGGAVREEAFEGHVLQGLALDAKGRRLFTRTSGPTNPGRIEVIDLKKGRSEVLFDPNPGVADWTLARSEIVQWTGPEGTALEGILYVPNGSDGQGMKLLVMPHGGPDSVSTERFDGWAHFFALNGYAVFHPNYRGGVAYGRDFYAANRGRLGEIELMDIEAGVDHLVATGRADATHLYYGGWSWGGYLTAWTIGHTTRYRAAVAGAAVVDTVAQYVGSDINHGKVADWEFTGRPWADVQKFDAANPRLFLHQVKTPTLVLHGRSDRRVPFDQGVTLYRALVDNGVETELYAYPGAGHGLSKPAHQVHRLETWRDWLDRH
ncbi:MAG: S9 family peptidase [Alphaproteobacteria bacterium]|nr:S9 family peptidase [Alphaproteobacteria bacterium]